MAYKSSRRRAADAELEKITKAAFASAHHFTCTIYSNHRYVTWRHRTLGGARALRGTLERLVANDRKALVYAVTHDGMTHLIPDNFNPGNLATQNGENR